MDIKAAVEGIKNDVTQAMAGLESWKKRLEETLGKQVTDEVLQAKIKEVQDFVEKKVAERKMVFPGSEQKIGGSVLKAYREDKTFRAQVEDKARKFINGLMKRDEVALKALETGVGEDGGFLVPEELADMIIEKREQPNHVMTRWTVMPVSSTSGEIPREGTDPVLNWQPDNTDGGETSLKFEQLKWTLHLLTGRVPMSRQVVADTKFPLADWFTTVMAKAQRKEWQNVFINGTGSGQPVGLRFNIPAIASRAQAGPNLAATDLISVRRDLAEEYRVSPATAWKIDGAIIALIEGLVDTQGRFLYLQGLAPQAPGTLLGSPVLEIPQIPNDLGGGSDESLIFYGDTSFYLWFDRGEMAVESTTEGAGAFEKHQVIFKMFTRVDGALSQVDSYVQLTGVK